MGRMGRTFAIGDIHGEAMHLERLLAHLPPLTSDADARAHFRLLREGLLAWMEGRTQPQGMPFPTTAGAYPLQDNYGLGDFIAGYAFVSKINPTGTALVYSSLLGTLVNTLTLPSIAVDANGAAYVTGATKSPTFPTTAGAAKTPYLRTR